MGEGAGRLLQLCQHPANIMFNWMVTRLQPHQCFVLNSLRGKYGEYDIPWEELSLAFKNIMVFENNVGDFHRALHIHGNLAWHIFVDRFPRRNIPQEISKLLEPDPCTPLRFRHVWLGVDDYRLTVVHRGEQWFENQVSCRQNALSSRPDNYVGELVLTVESVCGCYLLTTDHVTPKCVCLCHLRMCTHILTDHIPSLSSCHCVDGKGGYVDGTKVYRCPWKRLVYTETLFIFFIPETGVWFSSKYRDIKSAYESYVDSFSSQPLC